MKKNYAEQGKIKRNLKKKEICLIYTIFKNLDLKMINNKKKIFSSILKIIKVTSANKKK